jgi:hypothetical protein
MTHNNGTAAPPVEIEHCLTYESCTVKQLDDRSLRVIFSFSVNGGRIVESTLILPSGPRRVPSTWDEPPSLRSMEPLVFFPRCAAFHVGLVVLTWVWLSFPSRDVRVRAGRLDSEQVGPYFVAFFFCVQGSMASLALLLF